MDTILEVKNLCKTYIINKKQNNVLKNVNLSIKAGDMAAVMGASGSGKSTLLYSVSGMDNITAGEVKFCGSDISGMDENQLAKLRLDNMGFIFQQMYMLKNLSILDNIILPACQSGKIKEKYSQTAERARALMHKLGISDIADNDINEVSGGQLQRACICRGMINKPDIVFADEPTGALDRSASSEVMEELGRINNEGTTVMLVTHDVKVAARCTRLFYIADGNIEGEYDIGKYTGINKLRERERQVSNWLMEMGW